MIILTPLTSCYLLQVLCVLSGPKRIPPSNWVCLELEGRPGNTVTDKSIESKQVHMSCKQMPNSCRVLTSLNLCWAMAAIHGQPSNSFVCVKNSEKKSKIKANENAKTKQKQSKKQKQGKTKANNKAKTKRNKRQKKKNVAVRICRFFSLLFRFIFACFSLCFRFFS